MKECSIVTATYYLGDKAIGTIGVLGPTRMEYAKVVAVVEHLASVLNTVLSKLK
jgi:heat-inducible transcriptional repressor